MSLLSINPTKFAFDEKPEYLSRAYRSDGQLSVTENDVSGEEVANFDEPLASSGLSVCNEVAVAGGCVLG